MEGAATVGKIKVQSACKHDPNVPLLPSPSTTTPTLFSISQIVNLLRRSIIQK
jgi:hypothetical protein